MYYFCTILYARVHYAPSHVYIKHKEAVPPASRPLRRMYVGWKEKFNGNIVPTGLKKANDL